MRAWSILAASLLFACGAPAAGVGAGRSAADAAGDGPCGPREANLAGTCWSAEGTRWTVEADGPGGAYRFDIELLAAGRVRSSDHGAASPATDEWFQDGELLRVFLGNRFVEYRARITNGTVLLGEAVNVREQQWSWRADRVFGEASCAEAEARVDGACMTVAGTRWQLTTERGEARLIEFLDAGRLAVGDPGADELGRWEQDGSTLRFRFDGAPAEYVAEITDDRALRGTLGGEQPFEATRVAGVPPVVHR